MAGAFVLGEVAASLEPVVNVVFIILLFLVLIIYLHILRQRGKAVSVVPCLFLCTFFMAGVFRMWYENMPKPIEHIYARAESETTVIKGEVKDCRLKDENVSMTLIDSDLYWENKSTSVSVIAYAKLSELENAGVKFDDIRPGMLVKLTGRLKEISPAMNPGEFDYRLYYRSLGISYRFWADTVMITNTEVSPMLSFLYKLRKKASAILSDITVYSDTGVLSASILGDKTELSDELFDMYERNGIAHLLAISGLHVSIIGMCLYGILRKSGGGYALSGIIAGIWLLLYAIFTGASASVVRAVFMLICHFYADYLGRTYDLLSALSLSAVLLLFYRPYLLYQGGFQLAYAALLAVGIYVPAALKYIHPQRAWEKAVMVSACIQIITAPVILYHYFAFPVYAVILNIIVIPLMTYVISSGIIAIITGFFWRQAAVFAIGMGHYILLLYYLLCSLFEKLPYYSIILGRPQIWQICLYYCAVSAAFAAALRTGTEIIKLPEKYKSTVKTIILVAAVYPGLLLLCRMPSFGKLYVTFLSVGQGDGIYMQYDNVNMLTDCGSSTQKEIGKYTLEPFLKSRGVKKLDYVWVSHADMDHVNGIEYLLEKGTVKIKKIILPICAVKDTGYDRIKMLCTQNSVEVLYMSAGNSINIGELRISCLYPADPDTVDSNAQSQVLHVTLENFDMLLTGDMESSGEEYLTANCEWLDNRNIEVLKAAHHGSKYSSTAEFLNLISPEYTVLSYGEGNRYGHPAPETVERIKAAGSCIKETAKDGAISLLTDGRQLQWSEFKNSY